MTWNLWAGDTAGKLARLVPRPDVAVLCEVRRQPPPAALGADEPAWLWNGVHADRGLAIASWTGPLTAAPSMAGRTPGTFSVAGTLSQGLGVLGIWACPPAGSGPKGYADQILASVAAYEDLLVERPCIIAGDFNFDPGGDTDTRYGLTARLRDLGYVSAYHAFHGLAHGEELHSTHFHHFDQERPFHIDLVFLSAGLLAKVRSVEVAPYDGWVTGSPGYRSDHVPVTVEIDLFE